MLDVGVKEETSVTEDRSVSEDNPDCAVMMDKRSRGIGIPVSLPGPLVCSEQMNKKM